MNILGFLFDSIHYLIGIIIVCLLVCVIIKVHNYYSRNNITIPVPLNPPLAPAVQQKK